MAKLFKNVHHWSGTLLVTLVSYLPVFVKEDLGDECALIISPPSPSLFICSARCTTAVRPSWCLCLPSTASTPDSSTRSGGLWAWGPHAVKDLSCSGGAEGQTHSWSESWDNTEAVENEECSEILKVCFLFALFAADSLLLQRPLFRAQSK